MEFQTAVLDVSPNTPEQKIAEHLSQNSRLYQRSHNQINKDHARNKQRKGNEKKIMYVRNLHETVAGSDLGELFGTRKTNYLKDDCSKCPNCNKMKDTKCKILSQTLLNIFRNFIPHKIKKFDYKTPEWNK